MQGVNVTTQDPEVEIDWLELGHGFSNTSDVNQAAFLLGLSLVFSNEPWGSAQIAGLGYEVREGQGGAVVLEVLREIVGSIEGGGIMKVGDKVRVRISDGLEGVISAVFPEDGDANIRVRTESPAGNISWGDFYESELEVVK